MQKYLGLLTYLKELQASEKQHPVHCIGISPWGQSVTDMITKPIEVQRSFISTLSLFKEAKEKYTRGNGSKTKPYPY